MSIFDIRLLIIVCCFSFHSFVTAQTTVTGIVTDAETGEEMPFVNVLFENTSIGASTGLSGEFTLFTELSTVDSISASFVGYNKQIFPIELGTSQIIHFALEPSTLDLDEIVVTPPDEPPGVTMFKKVVAHKKKNNPAKVEQYQYEVYNKIEVDMNNLSDQFKNRKYFKDVEFIFDHTDTLNGKEYLPVFLSENLSKVYYKSAPKIKREVIKASRITGLENESISRFLGDMYQTVNPYKNFVNIFGRNFVSPIASSGKRFYKYYLTDSTFIDNLWCYQVEYKPKRKGEPTFYGDFWVHDTTFALKSITASIDSSANINFLNSFQVTQEFSLIEDTIWMLESDQLLADFNLRDKAVGFFGKRNTTYQDIKTSLEGTESIFENTERVSINEEAVEHTDDFWDNNRHIELSKEEKEIYHMIDSVKEVPRVKRIANLTQMLSTGYYPLGLFEIGPYYTFYSINPIENNRFKIGGRTSNKFSKKVEYSAHLAYGEKDQRFKYGLGVRHILSKLPRRYYALNYRYDIRQLGRSSNAYLEDNILNSIGRNDGTKLTMVESFKALYDHEWFTGFNTKLTFHKRTIEPLGSLSFFKSSAPGVTTDVPPIHTSEIEFYVRFAQNERFINGQFERKSLGSRRPIIDLSTTFGVKDFFGGQFNYQKLAVSLKHKLRFGNYGKLKYRIEAGKTWGKIPFPLLRIHYGNESITIDDLSFNTMNYFEFMSDQYILGMFTHHFSGYFLNKIPLIKKLKWRELIAFRALYGKLSNQHNDVINLPPNTFSPTKPFMEASVGIENIFKVLRIDALWRLSHLDHPNITKFGIRFKLTFSF